MKNMLSFLSVLIFLVACQAAALTTPTPTYAPTPGPDIAALLPQAGQKSMKGYELYSWQENGRWVYALLVGTNREKSLEEIQSPQARLADLEQLKKTLTALPTAEFVTWMNRPELAYPPEDVIAQIRDLCARQGLELALAR